MGDDLHFSQPVASLVVGDESKAVVDLSRFFRGRWMAAVGTARALANKKSAFAEVARASQATNQSCELPRRGEAGQKK